MYKKINSGVTQKICAMHQYNFLKNTCNATCICGIINTTAQHNQRIATGIEEL